MREGNIKRKRVFIRTRLMRGAEHVAVSGHPAPQLPAKPTHPPKRFKPATPTPENRFWSCTVCGTVWGGCRLCFSTKWILWEEAQRLRERKRYQSPSGQQKREGVTSVKENLSGEYCLCRTLVRGDEVFWNARLEGHCCHGGRNKPTTRVRDLPWIFSGGEPRGTG